MRVEVSFQEQPQGDDPAMGEPAPEVDIAEINAKIAAGEFSAKLTELHDPWWNSIARTMA